MPPVINFIEAEARELFENELYDEAVQLLETRFYLDFPSQVNVPHPAFLRPLLTLAFMPNAWSPRPTNTAQQGYGGPPLGQRVVTLLRQTLDLVWDSKEYLESSIESIPKSNLLDENLVIGFHELLARDESTRKKRVSRTKRIKLQNYEEAVYQAEEDEDERDYDSDDDKSSRSSSLGFTSDEEDEVDVGVTSAVISLKPEMMISGNNFFDILTLGMFCSTVKDEKWQRRWRQLEPALELLVDIFQFCQSQAYSSKNSRNSFCKWLMEMVSSGQLKDCVLDHHWKRKDLWDSLVSQLPDYVDAKLTLPNVEFDALTNGRDLVTGLGLRLKMIQTFFSQVSDDRCPDLLAGTSLSTKEALFAQPDDYVGTLLFLGRGVTGPYAYYSKYLNSPGMAEVLLSDVPHRTLPRDGPLALLVNHLSEHLLITAYLLTLMLDGHTRREGKSDPRVLATWTAENKPKLEAALEKGRRARREWLSMHALRLGIKPDDPLPADLEDQLKKGEDKLHGLLVVAFMDAEKWQCENDDSVQVP